MTGSALNAILGITLFAASVAILIGTCVSRDDACRDLCAGHRVEACLMGAKLYAVCSEPNGVLRVEAER